MAFGKPEDLASDFGPPLGRTERLYYRWGYSRSPLRNRLQSAALPWSIQHEGSFAMLATAIAT